MGANAQTSVPLFVANSVLTAAQQNISAATGIPVFATTVTRDAAFGGSNKVLAEGQLCYLESTDVVQYYTGSAWATVGPSSAGGLVCVKAETAFSAVASFTADGVFTSSYTNYLINMIVTQSANEPVLMNLRASAVDASTNYNYQRGNIDGTSLSAAKSTAQSSGAVFGTNGGSGQVGASMQLFGPQLAAATNYLANAVTPFSGVSGIYINQYYGIHSTATAYDGIKFSVGSGTMTGTYSIYGYAKTV